MIFWKISSGKPPFQSVQDQVLLFLEVSLEKRETPIDGTPPRYTELYQNCWGPIPEKRPDIEYIVNYLSSILIDFQIGINIHATSKSSHNLMHDLIVVHFFFTKQKKMCNGLNNYLIF
ncbi:kinase-like protein [Gigaspora margarita]|uniref:Kinase-like protein n=1 Tax=Gigaspora margarita TaxID=4874 RepID=A0A8H4AYG1_GIGMA|nr:kinase-like protein [Gigaspora margarita]